MYLRWTEKAKVVSISFVHQLEDIHSPSNGAPIALILRLVTFFISSLAPFPSSLFFLSHLWSYSFWYLTFAISVLRLAPFYITAFCQIFINPVPFSHRAVLISLFDIFFILVSSSCILFSIFPFHYLSLWCLPFDTYVLNLSPFCYPFSFHS